MNLDSKVCTVINICPCFCSSGGGEAGPGCRLWLSLREAASDGPELHPAAHTHPAIHLRGRRLERLLLVHRAWCWQSWGTTTLMLNILYIRPVHFMARGSHPTLSSSLSGLYEVNHNFINK